MRKILHTFKKKKGSFKDPFLYLGLISVVLLLILVFPTHLFLTKLNSFDLTKSLQASLLNLNLTKDFASQKTNNSSNPFVGAIKNSFKESPDLLFVQKNSLMAVSSPSLVTSQTLGSLVGEPDREIIEHTIQDGDTLTGLAEKYNISLETILWVNDLNKNSKIKPGQTLVILPVSGVIHYVKKGDTLVGIAKTYKNKEVSNEDLVDKIIAFNELSNEDDIYIGDILIIPNGVIPAKPKQQIAKKSPSLNQIPITSSYFIVPVPSPYLITQGLHWYNAVDLSHKGGSCGNPVYAAASGTVLKAKYGWNSGAGNNVSILHSNGIVTVYYHLQTILVKPGQEVLTGEQIGTIGATGRSTGCHLHFGVIGAKNPFVR